MPSSYTDLLRLTKPADGELVGTWGQTVNNGITELEEDAIAGTAAVPVTDGADTVLTVANGAADQARAATLNCTGALTAQRNVICPSSSKNYFVRNNTTGGFGVQIKTAAGTGVVVPPGRSALVYCTGANVVEAVTGSGAFVLKTGDTMTGPLEISSALEAGQALFSTRNLNSGLVEFVLAHYGLDVGLGNMFGSGSLALVAGGTEKMRVGADGRVSIGTSTPSETLTVRGRVVASSAPGGDTFVGTVVDSFAELRFGVNNTGATNGVGALSGTGYLGSSTGAPLVLTTLGTEKLRIDANGSVGIGVIPVAWSSGFGALQLKSGSQIAFSGAYGTLNTNLYYDGSFRYITAGVGASYSQEAGEHKWWAAASGAAGAVAPMQERMRIGADGNVGIGESNPTSSGKLSVTVNTPANAGITLKNLENNGLASLHMNGSAGGIPQWSGSAVLEAITPNGLAVGAYTGDIRFETGARNERMRIQSDGRILVGNYASTDTRALVQFTVPTSYPLLLRNNNAGSGLFWLVGPNPGSAFVVYDQNEAGMYMLPGGTIWNSSSDERSKTDFVEFTNAVDKVVSLRSGLGRFLTDAVGTQRSFLIAQDVQAVLPSAVSIVPTSDPSKEERLGLAYTDVIPLLVAAIKELNLRLVALGG